MNASFYYLRCIIKAWSATVADISWCPLVVIELPIFKVSNSHLSYGVSPSVTSTADSAPLPPSSFHYSDHVSHLLDGLRWLYVELYTSSLYVECSIYIIIQIKNYIINNECAQSSTIMYEIGNNLGLHHSDKNDDGRRQILVNGGRWWTLSAGEQ